MQFRDAPRAARANERRTFMVVNQLAHAGVATTLLSIILQKILSKIVFISIHEKNKRGLKKCY